MVGGQKKKFSQFPVNCSKKVYLFIYLLIFFIYLFIFSKGDFSAGGAKTSFRR